MMSRSTRLGIVSGAIIWGLLGTVQSSMAQSELKSKLDELADQLTFSISGEIAGVEGKIVYIGLGEKDGVHEGAEFEVVRLGGVMMVEKKAIHKETPIADIVITKVRNEMALARVTNSLAQIEKGDKVYQKQKTGTRITLTEFPYGENLNSLTRNIYESLAVSFARKGLQVLERSRLEKILQEQKISQSGMIDLGTAQKLGQLLGTEAILLGTVTDMGNSIAIRARWVDAGKGIVITAAEVEVTKAPEIIGMLGQGLKREPGSQSASVALHVGSTDKGGKLQGSSDVDKPAETEWFVASISRAAILKNETQVKLSIENITDEPLFLALNDRSRPVLTDDESGISLRWRHRADGISTTALGRSGHDKENAYTRISPGEILDVGLSFSEYGNFSKDSKGIPIRLTIDLLMYNKGRVQRFSVSPGGILTPPR
jgi:hypothetical protein